MTRAFVTGIAGHLGKELARQLHADGVEVHGLTRDGTKTDDLGTVAHRLHVTDGSSERMVEIFQDVQPEVVYHLASLYCRDHRTADIVPLIASNVLLGTQLLEGMRLSSCRRMVTAGTFFQHYYPQEIAAGQHPADYRALNLYAASKQAFDDILAYAADADGLQAASLVLYEIYSEHDTRRKLMTVMADACAKGGTVGLPNDEFWVNFVHVEDVAAAFRQVNALMVAGQIAAGTAPVYSVCAAEDTAASQLVATFEEVSGQTLTVNRGAFTQPPRAMPVPWRGPVVPGWQAKVSLRDGVQRMMRARG